MNYIINNRGHLIMSQLLLTEDLNTESNHKLIIFIVVDKKAPADTISFLDLSTNLFYILGQKTAYTSPFEFKQFKRDHF